MFISPIFYYAIAGAVGALVNDLLVDNALIIPTIKNGKIYLGFVGPMIIGACAGHYIDGSITTAFMGGFMGKALITNLIPTVKEKLLSQKKET